MYQHEDFILAANYLSKDRDNALDDSDFWHLTQSIALDYLSSKKPDPSLVILSLKLISNNIP